MVVALAASALQKWEMRTFLSARPLFTPLRNEQSFKKTLAPQSVSCPLPVRDRLHSSKWEARFRRSQRRRPPTSAGDHYISPRISSTMVAAGSRPSRSLRRARRSIPPNPLPAGPRRPQDRLAVPRAGLVRRPPPQRSRRPRSSPRFRGSNRRSRPSSCRPSTRVLSRCGRRRC